METDTKICASCGRTMTWRKAWARNWDSVRYCSDACRRRKVRPIDRELERAILALLDRRQRGSSICPSEAARQVAASRTAVTGEQAQDGADSGAGPRDGGWRELMEPARRAARRLVASGDVEVTQRGKVVDPSTAKGPIRIRRR